MFDAGTYSAWAQAFEAVSAQPTALADGAQTRAALRQVQAMADRMEGLRAALLAQLDDSGGYADEGASSAVAWARRELRLSNRVAATLRAAGHTMRRLPAVGDAMLAGEVRLEHVAQFTSGLRKIDHALFADATDTVLLPLAKQADPSELGRAITRLDEIVHPERLDAAWQRGMDRHDLQVARAGDGFHVTGFVDLDLGARLKALLTGASAPRIDACAADGDAGAAGEDAALADLRTPAQRRIDVLSDLVDAALAQGLPGAHRARPQVHVTVDATWLSGQPGAAPPELDGVGAIGPDLYGFLACGSDHTAILTHGTTGGPTPYAAVLNVGRRRRLATGKQRDAVRVRQEGRCAGPGCRHTSLDLHHVAWWHRDGGRTDLDNLVGLCRRCHVAVHTGRLEIRPDGHGGYTFWRTLGRSDTWVEDHERVHRQRLRDYVRGLAVQPARTPKRAPVGPLEHHRNRHTMTPLT
ncbi:DUF222 domain-containing protein [Mumia sp. ZJ1417]|uniref:HNH endonuclease n=1 Tax=Mumia sp. ZJ1417 TaxID=2708082 RepID=UPI00142423BD|nr:HNH endonuclease [Mumia sp. ZJ1417]QMW68075.1 DUF222 domain-containing protein [Mumia sp. ZJ1417]